MKPQIFASKEQKAASDPRQSVWVTAHAGSGKTHVLANRVIRLLLSGTEPERILCLTFTKAAASEMSTRVFNKLAGWIALDKENLIKVIYDEIGEARFDEKQHDKARQLFTRALETPGGLKIQTIHAFCERLLHRFPAEAGVVPGFSVMTDEDRERLLQQARQEVFASAAAFPEGPIASDIARVASLAASSTFDELVDGLLAKRTSLAWIAGSIDELRGHIADVLDVNPQDTIEGIADRMCSGMDRHAYVGLRDALLTGTAKGDVPRAQQLDAMLAEADTKACSALLVSFFWTKENDPRKLNGMMTKKVGETHPEALEFLQQEQERVIQLAEAINNHHVLEATEALTRLGLAIIGHYEGLKQRLGQYDFNDLITRTRRLLTDQVSTDWVMYKLDGGLDHILVDEAQDTSPEQWEVIAKLTEEFFAGQGIEYEVERTVFVVGDRKQSIFSFQGADPDVFDAMREDFRNRASRAEKDFPKVPLNVSYRSTRKILCAVDEVFERAAARFGVADPGDHIIHEPVRQHHAGMIEVWPVVPDEAAETPDPWSPPAASQASVRGHVVLARKIASTIKNWVDNEERLPSRNRPIRFGDVLILLRKRTPMADALVRALKQHGVPVAGADRLYLNTHMAVQDMVSLGSFVLLPDDDLSLAEVLKSPLVERDDGKPIEDEDLFRLAHNRKPKTLWQSLKQVVANGGPYRQARDRLQRWLSLAGFVPSFEFFSSVLNEDGGRRRLMARLGSEAAEPLDAFLALALDHERENPASLNGFLAFLESTNTEIKRDMEHGGNEVRVMTVHGAKGLEADIVFLPDTCRAPESGRNDPLAYANRTTHSHDLVPVWSLNKKFRTTATTALKERAREETRKEHNRLLYVAMTRARDRLYVCGWGDPDKLPDNCWYSLISEVHAVPENEVKDGNGNVLCWRSQDVPTEGGKPQSDDLAIDTVHPCPPPTWALTSAAAEPEPQAWLSPSRFPGSGDDNTSQAPVEKFISPLEAVSEARFKRGNLVHRLLQILPDVEASERPTFARKYLLQPGHGLEPEAIEALLDEVLTVLNEGTRAGLFGPDSQAEVPIAATISLKNGEQVKLSGQIDRLAVSDAEVSIVDFKTNRPPPDTIEGIAPVYVRQMAAYRAALARIYPDRPVRAYLLWTHEARLMEVPDHLLDGELPVTSN